MQPQLIEFYANAACEVGYLARPEGEGIGAGVVVVQEWWGLDAHIKSIADRFADAGFVALAPDFYRGQVAKEPDEARKLAMELQYPQAQAVMQGAVNYLLGQPFVQPNKIGIVGFCMGGRLASMFATTAMNLSAAVAFYGVPPLSDEQAAQITAPILAIYGETDGGFPPSVIAENDRKLTEAGKTHETIIYPGAPHAFFNDTRPQIYNKEASENAWERTVAWFRQYLK
jgi:carboxymethylenebutenolidase